MLTTAVVCLVGFLVLCDMGHLHNKVMERLKDIETRLDSIEKATGRIETGLEMRDLRN